MHVAQSIAEARRFGGLEAVDWPTGMIIPMREVIPNHPDEDSIGMIMIIFAPAA